MRNLPPAIALRNWCITFRPVSGLMSGFPVWPPSHASCTVAKQALGLFGADLTQLPLRGQRRIVCTDFPFKS